MAIFVSASSGHVGKLGSYDGSSEVRSSATVNDGNWHHLVLVNKTSDNTQKLYLDGNTTPAISHSLSTGTKTANAIQVGYYDGYVGTYNFDGNIDQIIPTDITKSENLKISVNTINLDLTKIKYYNKN